MSTWAVGLWVVTLATVVLFVAANLGIYAGALRPIPDPWASRHGHVTRRPGMSRAGVGEARFPGSHSRTPIRVLHEDPCETPESPATAARPALRPGLRGRAAETARAVLAR